MAERSLDQVGQIEFEECVFAVTVAAEAFDKDRGCVVSVKLGRVAMMPMAVKDEGWICLVKRFAEEQALFVAHCLIRRAQRKIRSKPSHS